MENPQDFYARHAIIYPIRKTFSFPVLLAHCKSYDIWDSSLTQSQEPNLYLSFHLKLSIEQYLISEQHM